MCELARGRYIEPAPCCLKVQRINHYIITHSSHTEKAGAIETIGQAHSGFLVAPNYEGLDTPLGLSRS